MPRREERSISAKDDAGPSLRVTLVRPDDVHSGRRPTVVINRGLTCTEQEIDLLEALASAMAETGIVAALPEPRTAALILDDFNGFSLADEIADVRAAIGWLGDLEDVDTGRLSLIGWSFGAIAAVETAALGAPIDRLCLLNPVTPSSVAARAGRVGAGAIAAIEESLPARFREDVVMLAGRQSSVTFPRPLAIVHAAGDRIVVPDTSLEFVANRPVGSPVERWLVARADHLFAEPSCRDALIERVSAFILSAGAPSSRSAGSTAGAAT